jgi:hypothetical protein
LEKRHSVDQKRQAVWALMRARSDLFRCQGAVIRSWRSYQGRKLGPYYRLAYREGGRQRTLYLGSSPELAGEVRQALHVLQVSQHRQRTGQRQWKTWRAALRRQKLQWDAELRRLGLYLKGYEVRGYRRARGL